MRSKGEGSIVEKVVTLANGQTRVDYYARVSWRDESGKRHEQRKKAKDKKEASRILRDLVTRRESYGQESIQADRITVAQVVAAYLETHVRPAVFVDGKKVSGLRSLGEPRRCCRLIAEFFNSRPVRSLTYSDLVRFQDWRTGAVIRQGDGQRSHATINREMSYLRAVLGFAVRNNWLVVSPFRQAKGLISTAQEVHRDRVLSPDEEERLLDACVEKRQHLRGFLICALDTGMRKGEIYKLRWADVDLVGKKITIQAFNTKTLKTRIVPISKRLMEFFEQRIEQEGREKVLPGAELVFGEKDLKRSFKTACRLAGIKGFKFHDCRHTFVTGLLEGGLSPTDVARLSGHTQLNTLYRYANVTPSTLVAALGILDKS